MAEVPQIYVNAQRIRDCVLDWLGEDDAPARACVVAGNVAWDDCECGQLTVAFTQDSASANFPNPSSTTNQQWSMRSCGHPLVVWELNVTLLRCAPTGEGQDAPSCQELEDYALRVVQDAIAVRKSVECCLQTLYSEKDVSGRKLITDWLTSSQYFVGPNGGCGGSNLPITIGMQAICECGD